MDVTPELLTAIGGLIIALTALVKAIRGDARKLDELEPAGDAPAGDVDEERAP